MVFLKKLQILFLVVLLLAAASCKDDSSLSPSPSVMKIEQPSPFPVDTFGGNDVIIRPDYLADAAMADEVPYILDTIRHDPYDLDIMDSAYSILLRKLPELEIPRPKPTHTYFRVLPEDQNQLDSLLSDTSICYSDVPFEREILNPDSGTYFQDPECLDEYTWLYAVIPYDKHLPETRNVEVVHYCYIPEYDTDTATSDANELLEYIAYLITDNLSYYSASEISNYEQRLSQPSSHRAPRRASGSARHYVSGQINVENVQGLPNTSENPLRYARVKLHVFTKVDYLNLTYGGTFSSDKRFIQNPHMCIIFKNTLTDDEIWGGWHWRSSARKTWRERVPRKGISITIPHSDISWRWATVNNAVVAKYDIDSHYNIPSPAGLRIWVISNSENSNWAGSTPLLNFASTAWHSLASTVQHSPLIIVGSPTISGIISTICSLSPTLTFAFTTTVSAAMFTRKPDVFIFARTGDDDTEDIYKLIFHELGHASHYMQAGDEYWTKYISYIVTNKGYGKPSDPYAEYCGVGEALADYMEDYYFASLGRSDNWVPERNYQMTESHWWNRKILPYVSNRIVTPPYMLSIGTIFAAFSPSACDFATLESNLVNEGVPSSILIQAHSQKGEWTLISDSDDE